MNANSIWKRIPRHCALGVALGGLVSLSAGSALAACGLSYPLGTPGLQRQLPAGDGARLTPAVYRQEAGEFIHVDLQSNSQNFGIVGLWKVTFVSDGVPPNPVPRGVQTDFGTVQWHDDGTEFMISGGRPPSEGDVCMGVWEQTGHSTYKLKHIALAWVSQDTPPSMGGPGPTPAQFLGPAIIKQTVTLNRARDGYQGPFSLDQYNADESQVLVHLSGTVMATRVTVD